MAGASGILQPPAAAPAAQLPVASWIKIHHDDSVLVRTGRTEIGTGMSA